MPPPDGRADGRVFNSSKELFLAIRKSYKLGSSLQMGKVLLQLHGVWGKHLRAYAKKVGEQLPPVTQPTDPSMAPDSAADKKIKRLVLCSGKVAFDLIEKRDEEGLDDVSIVRIEQLYPFPGDPLAVRIKRMTNLEQVVWCQEEPRNNGAWFFVGEKIEAALAAAGKDGMRPTYAGREEAASPATGLAKRHQTQQEALVTIALGLADGGEAKRALKKKEIAEKKV